MNTQFIRKTAKKHGKAAGWSSIVLAIVGLIIQAYFQRSDTTDHRAALWQRIGEDEKRIDALEKQNAFEQGECDARMRWQNATQILPYDGSVTLPGTIVGFKTFTNISNFNPHDR